MNVAQFLVTALQEADPRRVALGDPEGSRTFGMFGQRVGALTAWLRAQGAGPGERVGILSRNTLDYLEVWWSIIAVGAAAVPLNFRLAPPELRRILDATPMRGYFCSGEYVGVLGDTDDALGGKFLAVWGEGGQGAQPEGAVRYEDIVVGIGGADFEVTSVPDGAPFSIMYTGGTSTGSPKGVIRTHGNALAHAFLAPGQNFSGRQRTLLCSTPLFHAAGQIALFNLLFGGTVVLSGAKFDAKQFLHLVGHYGVEAAFVVPTIVMELTQVPAAPADVATLREVRCGSAPLPLEIARRLVAMYPGLWFGNGAGSTEAGTYAIASWDEMSGRPFGCVGRTPLGQEVRIIREDGAEAPFGDMGEIFIRGGQVSPGFWAQPERTSGAYHEGWFKTGDMGWIDEEGLLYLVDRKGDLIISGGENVYAREVEEVLYEVTGVAEAAVVGMSDPRWGEVPVAAIVASEGASPVADIEAALTQKLARYKHPRRVVLFDKLPKTAVGKIDKRELRDQISRATDKAFV